MGHVKSASFNIDGKEVLLPTVHKGKKLTNPVKAFREGKTKAIGVFKNPASATAASKFMSKSAEKGAKPLNPSRPSPHIKGKPSDTFRMIPHRNKSRKVK